MRRFAALTVLALVVVFGFAVCLRTDPPVHEVVPEPVDPGLLCAQFCEQAHGWVVQIEGRPGELPICTCSTWRLSAEGEYWIDPVAGATLLPPGIEIPIPPPTEPSACEGYCDSVFGMPTSVTGRPGEAPHCTCDTWLWSSIHFGSSPELPAHRTL